MRSEKTTSACNNNWRLKAAALALAIVLLGSGRSRVYGDPAAAAPSVSAPASGVVPATGPTTHPHKHASTQPKHIEYYDAKGPLPQEEGFHKLSFETTIDGKSVSMKCLIYLPVGYEKLKTPAPVILFLHGAGEAGDDLQAVYIHGPNHELVTRTEKEFKETFPFIVISPQCPPRGQRWDQAPMYKGVVQLMHILLPKLKADVDRVYVTGLSMGGKGTWFTSLTDPDLFAAIAPISADTFQPKALERLRYLTIWCIAGAQDGDVTTNTRKIGQMLADAGDDVRVSVVPDRGHDVWIPVYHSPQFYEWLLTNRRLDSQQRAQRDAHIQQVELANAAATKPTTANSEHGAVAVDPAQDEHPKPATKPAEPLTVPAAPGHYEFVASVKIGDDMEDIHYTIYLPPNYPKPDAAGHPTARHLPLLVYLHDEQTVGMPVQTAHGLMALHGPEALVQSDPRSPYKSLVILSPKCPAGMGAWNRKEMTPVVLEVIRQAVERFFADHPKVVVTGVGDGGAGAWNLAVADPEDFTGALPIVGNETIDVPNGGDALKRLPVIVCVGQQQTSTISSLKQLFAAKGSKFDLETIPSEHQLDLDKCYDLPAVIKWLTGN